MTSLVADLESIVNARNPFPTIQMFGWVGSGPVGLGLFLLWFSLSNQPGRAWDNMLNGEAGWVNAGHDRSVIAVMHKQSFVYSFFFEGKHIRFLIFYFKISISISMTLFFSTYIAENVFLHMSGKVVSLRNVLKWKQLCAEPNLFESYCDGAGYR